MRYLTSLTTKLTVLVALPLVALVVVAGLGVLHASDAVGRSRTTTRNVDIALVAADVARQLSLESGLSTGSSTVSSRELRQQRHRTDETVERLEHAVAGSGEATQLHMDAALAGLDQLDRARRAADGGTDGSAGLASSFDAMSEPVLDVDRLLARTDAAELVRRLDAHLALTRAIQSMGRQRQLIAGMLGTGVIDPTGYGQVVEATTSERDWLSRFEDTAVTEDLDRYTAAQAAPTAHIVRRLRDDALAAGPGGAPQGDPKLWATMSGRRIESLVAMADETASDLRNAAAARQSTAEHHRTVAIVLLAGSILLALSMLALAQRLVPAPVRVVATARGLPTLVVEARAPRDAGGADEPSGSRGSSGSSGPNGLSATDEPRALSSVFLRFGQRTQRLVTEQLSHIDHLEARADDPDALADLFVLDHLTTRLRRNAESLVVLAGAESPRPWARPVSAVNVVRAAVAETVDYSRVDLHPMDPATVVGACASDVSHLLAELIDNALAASPADGRVTITGQADTDRGYLIAVADDGPGMTARQRAEANELIARTPVDEVGHAPYFGLFVVGRLAQRHGLTVRLEPSHPDGFGVTANVHLPSSLLVDAAPATHESPASKALRASPDDALGVH